MLCILGSMNLTMTDQKLNNEKNRATKPDKFEVMIGRRPSIRDNQPVDVASDSSSNSSSVSTSYNSKRRHVVIT